MKWMLVVVVFGLGPVKTNLMYDSLTACLQADYNMRRQWTDMLNAAAKPHGGITKWHDEDTADANFVVKQSDVIGTCIPHADLSQISK